MITVELSVSHFDQQVTGGDLEGAHAYHVAENNVDADVR